MGLFRQTTELSKIYRGSTELNSMYRGATVLWESAIPVILEGLLVFLDASNISSYPGTGTTWFDLSGNGKNATLVNGPTFNADPGYIDLDGTNDYISLSTDVSVTSLSVDMWIMLDDLVDGYLWILDNFDNPELRISVETDGRLRALMYDAGAYATTDYTTTSLAIGNWYHVVATVGNNDYKVYINGNLEINDTSGVYNGGGVGEHTLGTYNRPGGGYGGYRNTKYATFRYYNRIISAAEVLNNYNAEKSRFGL